MSEFRGRIAVALFLLVLAKLAVVSVPLALKRIIDELSRQEHMAALPVALLVGYALLRFSSTLFNELRDVVFSRVTQHTVATYALHTFSHLHALSARFHAQRRIGGLLPDIDRGTAGILTTRYSAWYTATLGVTFLLYCGFTLVFTARRAVFQRRVNRLDSNAKSLLTDSLIRHRQVFHQ